MEATDLLAEVYALIPKIHNNHCGKLKLGNFSVFFFNYGYVLISVGKIVQLKFFRKFFIYIIH